MAKNTAQVRLGSPEDVSGYAYSAPLGTTRPTATAMTLDAGYVDLGYISEDGVEVSTENGTNKIKDWNLDTVAVIQESNECTLTFTFLQKSPETARELFGADNVETSGTAPNETLTAIHYTGAILPHKQYAFPLKDGIGKQMLEVGDGQITSMSGFTLVKNDVIKFEVEIECFKDKDGRFFSLLGA